MQGPRGTYQSFVYHPLRVKVRGTGGVGEGAVEIGSWKPRRGGVWVCEWDSRGVCVGGGCESSVVLLDIGEGGFTRPPRVFPTPVISDVISIVFLNDSGGATIYIL